MTFPNEELPVQIEYFFDRLWPLMRSLTGDGVRATHDILGEILPLQRTEVPSGQQVFDWTVPKEWVVRKAYIIRPDGEKILDIKDNNLHLVSYSIPFQGTLPLTELDNHLHSLPDLPNAIPYVTSFYEPRWGFCLTDNQRKCLPDGDYEVVVDTELTDGSLTISEALLPGESSEEVLISTYTCHPSLANNELSGPLVAAFLYRRLASISKRRLSFRFAFFAETIGCIAYLALREPLLRERLIAGYVITCAGDRAPFTYKYSRRGNTLADRAAEYVLKDMEGVRYVPYSPIGSDERQYCSPGFNFPVGSLMRSMYGTFEEYHTSLDNKNFIDFGALAETVEVYARLCTTLDANNSFISQNPFCEPQLGKRGLYPNRGSDKVAERLEALLWLLNLSDGQHDLLSIATRSGLSIENLDHAAQQCLAKGLIKCNIT